MGRALFMLATPVAIAACVQTTGGQIVDFPVAAAGASDLSKGQPLHFVRDDGWDVVLTRATLHIGAVYLDSAAPVSGAQDTPCILPGTYVAQMTTGMDVDLLSPELQSFPALGHGTTGDAITAQLWLTGLTSDIDTQDDATKILVVQGTARLGQDVRPFAGQITIGNNRLTPGAVAGAAPICKQRVVSVLTDVRVSATGGLVVRIDARKLFTNVDWSALAKFSSAFGFVDAPNKDQPSTNLYSNLHAGSGSGSPYTFSWTPDL
jgi:hypothetical protein